MLKWLGRRPTSELLIILIALTICAGVTVIGTATIVFSFIHPDLDTSVAFRFITSVINTMIGLLAGFLAGRTERTERPFRPNGNDDGPG